MNHQPLTRREFVRDTAAVAAGAAMVGGAAGKAQAADAPDPKKARNYNENMEYRRLGRSGLMLSAVSMGGHWKRIAHPHGSAEFKTNRREVMAAALDHGINYIDACCADEVLTYAEALRGKRERHPLRLRLAGWARSGHRRLAGQDEGSSSTTGSKAAGLDYVDVWRVTLREQATKHAEKEIETIAAALEWGKKAGKARATGVSTHHRPWIAEAVAKYPSLEVIVTPYSAGQ